MNSILVKLKKTGAPTGTVVEERDMIQNTITWHHNTSALQIQSFAQNMRPAGPQDERIQQKDDEASF